MTGHPCYIELAVPDTAAARAFYGSLLGWPPDAGPQEITTPTLDIGGPARAARAGAAPYSTCCPYISPNGSAMSSIRAPSGSRK
ncbi:MAG: hypothetical protein JWR90_2236 [Marmoricola sp.]|jgi:predicted enzyme related to lactoylglutathione lyase|nr:hypothetical protein [Marmoricola sp.]